MPVCRVFIGKDVHVTSPEVSLSPSPIVYGTASNLYKKSWRSALEGPLAPAYAGPLTATVPDARRFDRGQPHPIPIYYTPKLTHLYPHITARTYDEFPLCRCWARNLVIAGYRAARRASVSPQSRPREMGTGSDSTATHSLHIPCHLHLRRTDGSSSIAH